MNVTPSADPWEIAVAFADLHCCESRAALESRFAAELARLLPGLALALCVAEDDGGQRARIVEGGAFGLSVGDITDPDALAIPGECRFVVRYRSWVLGHLFVARSTTPDETAVLRAAVAHFGTALGTLTLGLETQAATADYCASLQALEEGIVLFQEEDREAVLARLLSLATSMVQSTAGAVWVLREVGDPSSGLVLEQTFGIPEELVTGFRGVGGAAWPDVLLEQQASLETPGPGGLLAMLAPETVPPALRNVVVLPLRYHGVDAGLCLLFNAGIDVSGAREHVSRVQSLGQLGAALLHRLRLEALSARARSRQRELQIAEQIQKRLLPTVAPDAPGFTFAWASIAAQDIGGDYLDVFSQEAGVVHAVIADASGHGINSALLMSSFRSTYRANARYQTVDDLATGLNNEVVNEVGPTGMFITAALLRIDCAGRRMSIASAAHAPVLLWRTRTGRIESLESCGPPLGFLPGAAYPRRDLELESGDVMLLYTDGVTEATNADLDMFGEERLAELLQRHAGDAPDAILAAVRTALEAFAGSDRYEDDVSMVVIRVG